ATARTAWRAPRVPGIVRAPVKRVVALVVQQQLRHIRLAEHDRPGLPQASDVYLVSLRPIPRPRGNTDRRGRSGEVERLLDRHRDTMERPERRPRRPPRVSLARLGASG